MRKIEILIMSISGMVEFIKIFIKIHWHVTGKRGKNVTRFMISNTDHFNVAKFELYYSLTIKNFHFAPLLKKKREEKWLSQMSPQNMQMYTNIRDKRHIE